MNGGWGLFLSLVIGAVGMVLFIYGKRQTRLPQIVAGLALMVYPYFVSGLWLMAALAVGILALLAAALRMGA